MSLTHAEESSVNKLAIRQHAIIIGERHYEINCYLCYDMLVNTHNMPKLIQLMGAKLSLKKIHFYFFIITLIISYTIRIPMFPIYCLFLGTTHIFLPIV